MGLRLSAADRPGKSESIERPTNTFFFFFSMGFVDNGLVVLNWLIFAQCDNDDKVAQRPQYCMQVLSNRAASVHLGLVSWDIILQEWVWFFHHKDHARESCWIPKDKKDYYTFNTRLPLTLVFVFFFTSHHIFRSYLIQIIHRCTLGLDTRFFPLAALP